MGWMEMEGVGLGLRYYIYINIILYHIIRGRRGTHLVGVGRLARPQARGQQRHHPLAAAQPGAQPDLVGARLRATFVVFFRVSKP